MRERQPAFMSSQTVKSCGVSTSPKVLGAATTWGPGRAVFDTMSTNETMLGWLRMREREVAAVEMRIGARGVVVAVAAAAIAGTLMVAAN